VIDTLELATRVGAARPEPDASVERMRRMHERRALQIDRLETQRLPILDQPLDNRPADAKPASRRPHEHPLDLARRFSQSSETTDPDGNAIDLGDVEAATRREQPIEHLGRMIRVRRNDDPQFDPDPFGRPVTELARELVRGSKLIGRLDASEAYVVAGIPRA